MRDATYRNIERPDLHQDECYGIEGRYLISIQANQGLKLRDENSDLTIAGKGIQKFWKQIPEHFNSVALNEHLITEDSFYGIVTIDLSGKKVGEKMIYYNVVSQFEIAFSLMVGKKNPFLVEGSVFHIITWLKAASLMEIHREGNNEFKWKSGYFDFAIPKDQKVVDVLEFLKMED